MTILLNGADAPVAKEPFCSEPTIKDTKRLYAMLEEAAGPSIALDAHIACWANGFTMHNNSQPESGFFQFWDKHAALHDCASWPAFTSDSSRTLALVREKAPDLMLIVCRHANGQWALAWSNDMAPRFDDTVFDEEFLALAIFAALLEALIDRDRRVQ
jgi:hypothetical protein